MLYCLSTDNAELKFNGGEPNNQIESDLMLCGLEEDEDSSSFIHFRCKYIFFMEKIYLPYIVGVFVCHDSSRVVKLQLTGSNGSFNKSCTFPEIGDQHEEGSHETCVD